MTTQEIKNFLPSLTDGEVVDLEAAANEDSGEGAEWLPYYKMALERLAECVGLLAAADANAEDKAEAARLWYQHLLFVGIGPGRCKDQIRRVEDLAAASMALMFSRSD